MDAPIYLDHNASTPVLPRVRDAIVTALAEGFGNPSADHAYGRRARAFVERAREQVAELLGCDPDEIVFTGSGTESNNLALRGCAAGGAGALALVTSAVDHPATLEPARVLERGGARVTVVGVDRDGVVDPDAVGAALDALPAAEGQTRLVSLLHAQNETGALQPIAEVAARARAKGALTHMDAAQAVGKVPVRVRDLGVDMASVAGHKLYAPKGVGALYVRRGLALHPLLVGAGHERGLRPGTENVAGIAGLGEACSVAAADLGEEARRQAGLRDRLEARLSEGGFVVHAAGAARLPNTSNGHFPGVRGSELMRRLPEVAFSTGSACHSGEERPSRVLTAMGLSHEDALGAVRLTLGRGTTEAHVEEAAARILAAAGGRGGG